MNLLDNIDSCIVSSKCIERFHNLHVTVRKHDCHAPPSVRAHAPPSVRAKFLRIGFTHSLKLCRSLPG